MTETRQGGPKDHPQMGNSELDNYHEIGIPAVNAAARATRRQVQQKDYTTAQQTAPLMSYED